jgi:tagatose 1,6-diphosphate aldolase
MRRADIPFFLELVNYGEGMEDKSAEFAQIKPEVVGRGMEEFSKQQYRVDVLKVGVPVNMAYVERSPAAGKEILHSRREAIAHYRRAASFAGVPFIYLSEGESNETFLDALELAIEAGMKFSGVLCGRATWQGGVPAFVQGGAKALEEGLQTNGVTNIKNVNKRAAAVPWCSAASELPLTKAACHKGGGRL